jgi:hypothetical protein
VTNIAENQLVVLAFNQEVDPSSVSSASISLRTASGEEPVGQYLTTGNTVAFVPEVQVVGGASFFGFKSNETYTMTLPGGPAEINALRSVGGDPFARPLSCNLSVTRGVIDLKWRAPDRGAHLAGQHDQCGAANRNRPGVQRDHRCSGFLAVHARDRAGEGAGRQDQTGERRRARV